MKTDDVVLLYTTWPDQETAHSAVSTILDAGLIACANIFPPHQSVYKWNGVVQSEQEVCVLMKTTSDRLSDVRTALVDAHPYDVPAIVAIPIDSASSHSPFVDWVRAATIR